MTKEFSAKQIQDAKEIINNDLVMQLDEDTFLVNSASRDQSYEVQRIYDKPYEWYCKCKGWQFSRVEKACKHCLVITMYLDHLKRDNI